MDHPTPDAPGATITAGWILCHRCGLKSYNPQDVLHRFCGRCHVFFGEEAQVIDREEPEATEEDILRQTQTKKVMEAAKSIMDMLRKLGL